MTAARTLLFAVAGGLAVGSLYLSQPLVETIASVFTVPASSAGLLVTITQIGYAIGIFLIVAIITLIIAVVLVFAIPQLPARDHVPYGRLLASVFGSIRRHPAVAPSLLVNAATFAVFSLFWTALTFLLTAEPFGYSTTQIGLMGIAGLAGALIARRAGWLHDKGWSVPATGAALGLLTLALVGAWLLQVSIIGLIVVVVILDVAVQSILVMGQTRVVSLSETERSRLNTAVVVANFIGGAVGSALAGTLWTVGGWDTVVLGALVLTLAALAIWAAVRNHLADTT